RFARVDEGQHLAFADRLLDLGGAENDLPGLVGEGERAERSLREKALDHARKSLRNPDFCLQGAGEDVALFGLGNAVFRRRDPDAPAWEPLLEVRDDGPIGGKHEAQQFVLGAAYARQSAAAEAVRRVPIALLLRRLMPQGLCLRSSSSRVFAARRGGLVRGLAFGRGGFRGLLWRFERGLVDPARLDPRIEDQLLDLLPAQAEVGEDAVVMDGLLLLVLPLGPAGEVVGGTIRQVLDR